MLPAEFPVGSVVLVDIAASYVIHELVALRADPPEELSTVEMLTCSPQMEQEGTNVDVELKWQVI